MKRGSESLCEQYGFTTLVGTCCVCLRVRDEAHPTGQTVWKTLVSFLKDKGYQAHEVGHSHTYCPDCYSREFKRVTQDSSNLNGSPCLIMLKKS